MAPRIRSADVATPEQIAEAALARLERSTKRHAYAAVMYQAECVIKGTSPYTIPQHGTSQHRAREDYLDAVDEYTLAFKAAIDAGVL
jgi:hypothetical protein